MPEKRSKFFDPKQHLVTRGGQKFINFTGLLAKVADDDKQIVETDSELIQIPNDENGGVAIVKATVKVKVKGEVLPFRAIGDASKDNVGTMVASALIRMAETRAWVRALRLVMRSETAAEEMPESNAAAEDVT